MLNSYLIIFLIYSVQAQKVKEYYQDYRLFYDQIDVSGIPLYRQYFDHSLDLVRKFTQDSFDQSFDIYVHPDRISIDSAWQTNWNLPSFHSDCWMVASGVGARFDLLSPRVWETEACEHQVDDTIATQKLIAHELFHVFHGQRNVSADFSETDNIDWFVEGFATYASGQCDQERIEAVKEAIKLDQIPASLDNFWTGTLRYGLSGSVVLYLDQQFGRRTILKLLKFNKKDQILDALKMSEKVLLTEWKTFILKFDKY